MKKFSKKFMLTAFACILISSGISVSANYTVGGVSKVDYKFIINDTPVNLPANYLVMSRNNTTYVPIRFVSENLGASVEFEQGTIKISSEKTISSSNTVQDLQQKIDELTKENRRLEKQLELSEDNMYRKLPTDVKDNSGLKITLRNVEDSNKGTTLDVEFQNTSSASLFAVYPYKTEIYVDGKVYNDVSSITDTLSATIARESTISGRIDVKGVNLKNKNGKVTFYYKINNGEYKDLTIYFNAK